MVRQVGTYISKKLFGSDLTNDFAMRLYMKWMEFGLPGLLLGRGSLL